MSYKAESRAKVEHDAWGTTIILTGPNLARWKLALKSNQEQVIYGINEPKEPTWQR